MSDQEDEVVIEEEHEDVQIDEITGDEEDDASERVTDDKDETVGDDEDEDETIVTLGDEEIKPEENVAPEWVRDLRKKHRESAKRVRELEAKLAEKDTPSVDDQLGPKPTLEDADYDTEVFEQRLTDWHEKKRNLDEKAVQVKKQKENEEKAWQETVQNYEESKQSLKIKDFEEAEETAGEILSNTQRGMILHGAENPALVMYALGKSPKKAQELSEIQDHVKFAFAVAKLESSMKISSKKTPPPPEKRPAPGSKKVTSFSESALDKLREEAERTGDYTKVHEYKRKMKAQKKAG
jgi:hypothetical protein